MKRLLSDLPPKPTSKFEYDAFISYRTGIIPDALVGEELQKVLESYPVPRSLKHHIVQSSKFRNRLKVFRDTTDLSAGADLGEAIKERLRVSRWLVVVCSPDTPRSTYCTDEVRYFEEYHGAGHVLLLLIAGEPHQSFPSSASRAMAASAGLEDNDHTSNEPLAADVRAGDAKGIIAKLHGRGIPKAKQARFKILAPLLGCASPDALIRRHRARVRRLIHQSIIAVLAVGLGVGWLIRNRVKQEAIRTNAEGLLAKMGLEDTPSESELNALWKLASQSKETRLEFLKQAVRVHPSRFNKRATMMARAAIGIDPALAQLAERELLRPLRRLEPANTDGATTRALLGLSLPVRDPDFIVAAYKAVLGQSTFHNATVLDENPPDITEGTIISRSLGYQFWRRVRSLDDVEQKVTVPHVLQAMKELKDLSVLSRWALLLRELKAVTPDQLRNATLQFIKAASEAQNSNEQTKETDERADTILEPYADLWKNAAWEFTQADVEAFAPLMIAGLQTNRTAPGVEEWRDRLIGLLKRAGPNARAVATPMIFIAMRDGAKAQELDEVLVKVPNLLTPECRRERVKTILDLIDAGENEAQKVSGTYAKAGLAAALSEFPEDLSPDDLTRAQAYFITVVSQTSDPGGIDGSLGIDYATKAIAALPKPLPESDYWKLAADLVKAMKGAAEDSTGVSLGTIAGASARLPKPSSRSAEGEQVCADIIEQIEFVDLDKSFFDERIRSWLNALRAFGGELEGTNRERLTAQLLAKMAATPGVFEVDDVITTLFALQCDPSSAGKVVDRIIDVYETEPSQGFNIISNSGLKDWRATLSPADYTGAVRRIVDLISGKKGSTRDLLKLMQELPKPSEAAALPAIKSGLLREIDDMRTLDGVTKARLRSLLQGRPLRTTDVPTTDILTILGEEKVELLESDRERVVSAIISAMQGAQDIKEWSGFAKVLKSVPFSLSDYEKHEVTNSIVTAFEKSQYVNDLEANAELLQVGGDLDTKQSNALVVSFMDKLRRATDTGNIWKLITILEALQLSLAAEDAAKLGGEICNAVNDPQNEWSLEYWYGLLGKINYDVSEEQRRRAAAPVIAHLRKVQTPLSDDGRYETGRRGELKRWLSALAHIPGGATAEDRRQARELTMAILYSTSYSLENYLSESAEVIALLPDTDEKVLIEMLKWPTLEPRSTEAVMTRLEKQAKTSFLGDVWRVARWAERSGFAVSPHPSRNEPVVAGNEQH